MRGTGLRPAPAAEAMAQFETQYAALLREAYPAAPYGSVFGFARTFIVTRKH